MPPHCLTRAVFVQSKLGAEPIFRPTQVTPLL
uniref:Uncharacterized protein n=1 Tax=Anguilla anguilla TaxID=7936 RepID=A0A0E9Q3C4_ANGAN